MLHCLLLVAVLETCPFMAGRRGSAVMHDLVARLGLASSIAVPVKLAAKDNC